MKFAIAMRPTVEKELQTTKTGLERQREIVSNLGARWRALSDSEKEGWKHK